VQRVFVAIAVGLSGEPANLVVESLLAGVGEFAVFPIPQQSFDPLADGLGHLLERGMQVVNLGICPAFGLLVLVTANSLGMVIGSWLSWVSFLLLQSLERNENQLLFPNQGCTQDALP